MGNVLPYSYALNGQSSAIPAILSQAGIDSWNRHWAILYGPNPVTAGPVNLAIEEDQAADGERAHTSEQAAFVVFGSLAPPSFTIGSSPSFICNISLDSFGKPGSTLIILSL